MNPYIENVPVNIQDGLFEHTISFNKGLNILSGENGTLKTKILSAIKSQNPTTNDGQKATVMAFSPKRNVERKNVEQLYNEIRQQNREFPKYIQDRLQKVMQDNTFDNYASFAEVFLVVYEERCKDGGEQISKMEEVNKELNKVLRKIFPNYELISNWNTDRGAPNIRLKKEGHTISMENLSLGEQEILALASNLYAAKDKNYIFLVDEPELHLNWHLEESLFNYFDWFCNEYDKQLIIATHSRVVFKTPFLEKTRFLYWKEGKVLMDKEIPDEQRLRIAGDQVNIIKLGEFPGVTFFVEDQQHCDVIKAIAKVLNCDVVFEPCKSSSNVRRLYELSEIQGGWHNCYFLEDGDNENNPYPNKPNFIHLDKYCIENYLLDFETMAIISNKETLDLQKIILDIIIDKKDLLLKKNKNLDFLFRFLRPNMITQEILAQFDGSIIFLPTLERLGIEPHYYLDQYVMTLKNKSKLNQLFPEQLINRIKGE